jgi:hypothetical protein
MALFAMIPPFLCKRPQLSDPNPSNESLAVLAMQTRFLRFPPRPGADLVVAAVGAVIMVKITKISYTVSKHRQGR